MIANFFVPLFFVLLEALTGLFDRRAQSSEVAAGAPAGAAPHAKREDD